MFFSYECAFCIEIKKNNSAESEWIRLEKISEIEKIYNEGDLQQVKILLEGFLDEYPGDVFGLDFEQKLLSRNTNTKVESSNSEDLWLEFERYKAQGAYKEARRVLLGIKMYDVSEELDSLDLLIERSSDILNLKKNFDTCKEISEISGRVKSLSVLYQDIIRQIDLHGEAKGLVMLRDELIKALDKDFRIEYAKAELLKEFEGCVFARKYFKKIRDIFNYRNLRQVDEEINKCNM